MPRTVRLLVATSAVATLLVIAARAAAPVTPSYQGVERTIQAIRKSWDSPGAAPQPNRAGWDALFDALLADLRAYGNAESETDRLAALDPIYQISETLGTIAWKPAATLREEVREWLRPRLRLAWARRRLSDAVDAMPATSDPTVVANRKRWVDFVRTDLGTALREYDSAPTVAKRQSALRKIHDSLGTLSSGNRKQTWWPSAELEAAVNDLFNRPNLDISADVNTVSPLFDAELVQSGPVERKGYISQVTAGPKTGFGLMTSDDGIAFYNKQQFTSVTPVWDFNNRMASDPRGQRAVKLYQFNATTINWSELTITTVLRGSGLQIWPSYTHNIDASITSVPTQGRDLGRAIAGLVGMDQDGINRKVYEGSIGRFRQEIPQEALEEAQERIAAETAERNADLRAKGLVGNDTLAIPDVSKKNLDFLITSLSLRSRPEGVLVAGRFNWKDASGQVGADAPVPAELSTIEPGIRASVHVGSLLGNLVAGIYERDVVRSVENLMVVIKEVPPGTPPREGIEVTQNVDFATFAKKLAESRKPKPGTPKTTVLRVTRPKVPPEFSTDARGFLVALIHDLQLEVPAPENQEKGGFVGAPAKIYRIKIPLTEISLSYKVDTSKPGAMRVQGKVEDFNPGADGQVFAIADDETKAALLSRFSTAFVLGAVGGQLRQQPIDVTLDQVKIPGLLIRSISPLDPSGWVRVNLERDPSYPLPAVNRPRTARTTSLPRPAQPPAPVQAACQPAAIGQR
jgi:hypothetical protein